MKENFSFPISSPLAFSQAMGALSSPKELKNLALWLDASDLSTITESGGSVSQLDDKSGNGNHATQSTGSNQPGLGTINGKNCLRSAASNQVMNLPHISGMYTGYTMYIVCMSEQNPAYAASYVYINGSSVASDKRQPFFYADVSNKISINVGGSPLTSGPPLITLNVPFLAQTGYVQGLAADIQIDEGTVYNTYNTTLTEGADLGRILGYSGYNIGEILIFTRNISVEEKNLVKTYLYNKWGI